MLLVLCVSITSIMSIVSIRVSIDNMIIVIVVGGARDHEQAEARAGGRGLREVCPGRRQGLG